ncbi:MAG: hypothetical protein R3E08_13280 [Thiotrichaceae bacterium]
MGKKYGKTYTELRKSYQEQGNLAAPKTAQALIETQPNISLGDRNACSVIWKAIPVLFYQNRKPCLHQCQKMPGLDLVRKCRNLTVIPSKACESPSNIEQKFAPCSPILRGKSAA